MKPLLIIKTANGYAVVPLTGEAPRVDYESIQVANKLDGSSYLYGPTVQELINEHFSAPKAGAGAPVVDADARAVKEAA